MRKITTINGAGLNLSGRREPEVYGSQTLEDYLAVLRIQYLGVTLHYFQSNSEGELVGKVHGMSFIYDGVIPSAGGYTHTLVALADAVKAISTPVAEMHILNTFAREAFRHHSYLSPVVKGCIAGFDMKSYELTSQSFMSQK